MSTEEQRRGLSTTTSGMPSTTHLGMVFGGHQDPDVSTLLGLAFGGHQDTGDPDGSGCAQTGTAATLPATHSILLLYLLWMPPRPRSVPSLPHRARSKVASHMRGFNGSAGGSNENSSNRKNEDKSSGSTWAMIGQLEDLLTELVESQPGVWGPLVASWAVEQLGRWSVEWANTVVGRGDATLEEIVKNWLKYVSFKTMTS
ncbi:unnamed protein product, partial [Meganyctiphanes norvegica]